MTDNAFQSPLGESSSELARTSKRARFDNPLLMPGLMLLKFSGFQLFALLLAAATYGTGNHDASTPANAGPSVGQLGWLVVGSLLLMIVVIYGAVGMLHLNRYRSAVAASIISIVPLLSPCFVLGIPFGIWALVLLLRSDVKAGFS